MKYSKINIFFIAILLSIFTCPFISMAQSSSSAIPAPQLEIDYPSLEPFATNPPTTPIGPNVLPNYIVYVFGFIIVVSAITAVVMIAIGGVEYISSAGSPEKMKSGISKITSSVLGLIILGCSFLILKTINPNLVKIDEPYVAPFVSEFNYGVWACKARIDFTDLRYLGDSLKSILKTSTGKNTGLQRRVKDYNEQVSFMNSNCYNVKTAGSAQKEYEGKISFMYLVPEEGKREFGAVIYDDNTAKSRARVMWSNKDPLYVISEWPILDKKVASIRPFVLINSPPTDWYANLYQLPHKNRGAPEAKKVQCSTKGNTRAWCDISGLAINVESSTSTPTPTPTPTPSASLDGLKDSLSMKLSQSSGESPAPTPTPTSSPTPTPSSGSSSKPPKITSVEFNGSQFLIFFRDDFTKWSFSNTTLNVVGPSDENNLSSGSYIMGEWNDECKEKRAEEPNSESYYPCAKKALLITAIFL